MPVTFTAVLAVPVVVALTLGAALVWQYAGALDAARRDAGTVHSAQRVSAAVAALRAERAAVAGAGGLGDARAGVDFAVGRLGSVLAVPADRPAEVASGQLSRLADVRRMTDPVAMTTRYSLITGALLDLDAALVARVSDTRLAAHLTAAHALARACEYFARQQDLLDLGLSQGGLGGAGPAHAREATVLAANWLGQFTVTAPGDDLAVYSAALPGGVAGDRDQLVTAMLGDGGVLHAPGDNTGNPIEGVGDAGVFRPVADADEWRMTGGEVVGKLGDVVTRLADSADASANASADEAVAALRNLVIVLAAAAIAAAALTSVVARHLRATARSLRDAVLDVARNKLPATLSSLRDGRGGDGGGPRLPAFTNGEFGELAAAFESVCGQAVGAVTEQVRLRSVQSEVFAGMARRTQSLVRHQIRLAGHCARNGMPAEVPGRAARLAARLRRTNENLLVLSGEELVRERAEPVPLAGVISAALSEIEQYQRVDVLDPPEAAVAPAAAGDLVRVLAELLDNATSFSPVEHEVIVQAQVLRDGSLSIALMDNGIGMSDEEVLVMNERLREPGSLEPARSARVGLLIVGRLAGKNGFGVELLGGDASPGVTAVVSVPAGLVLGPRAVLPAGVGRL
jgi:signal transduction histidine kinase